MQQYLLLNSATEGSGVLRNVLPCGQAVRHDVGNFRGSKQMTLLLHDMSALAAVLRRCSGAGSPHQFPAVQITA